MTCLEKLQEEHPDLIEFAKELLGDHITYFGCPHMFGYQTRPYRCNKNVNYAEKCTTCWNREFVEVKEKKYDL